jgi:hypothetical protein
MAAFSSYASGNLRVALYSYEAAEVVNRRLLFVLEYVKINLIYFVNHISSQNTLTVAGILKVADSVMRYLL